MAFADIGNYYTNLRLPEPEYTRIKAPDIPEEIMDEYDGDIYVDEDGYIYVEIMGALYGLKQARKIVNDDLTKHLDPYGYRPSKNTPGLWLHDTRKINFTLVVDDLGVKYLSLIHI